MKTKDIQKQQPATKSIKVDKSLDQYHGKPLFKKKLDEINKLLEKTGKFQPLEQK